MFNWSQDWQMLFNTDKSKVMHFGFNNKEVDYILGNQKLNAVEEERDLGVIVDKSLKSSRQCAKAAAAANAVLGMIRRTFLCKDKELILQLYKSLESKLRGHSLKLNKKRVCYGPVSQSTAHWISSIYF